MVIYFTPGNTGQPVLQLLHQNVLSLRPHSDDLNLKCVNGNQSTEPIVLVNSIHTINHLLPK